MRARPQHWVPDRLSSPAAGGAGPRALLRSAVRKLGVKQLCNPLDADQGALRPSGARGLAGLGCTWPTCGCIGASRLGCHWSRNGGVAGLRNGVGAGATVTQLAVAGRGRRLSLILCETRTFPWHRVHCHTPSEKAGASSPLPPHCSTGDGFPVLMIQKFWQKRKKGEGYKGEYGKNCFWS